MVLVAALGLSSCGTEIPTEAESDDRTLLVWGYVMYRSNPARGGAGLVDPSGQIVATTPVETGRYLVGLPLPPGTRVCDGYRVRVAIETGRSSQVVERVLDPESGACVVPSDAKAKHAIDFFYPSDTIASQGGSP